VTLRLFGPRIYKLRNRVERFFNRIKHYRAFATRYDKHDANFLASVKLLHSASGCDLMSL
jgi:transposase